MVKYKYNGNILNPKIKEIFVEGLLSEGTYKCECGYTNDRDIHVANNMILFYRLINDKETPEELREVPMDRLNVFKSKWGLKLIQLS